MNTTITTNESAKHSHTSNFESVRIEVEPKSVLQTSPARFADEEKTLSKRYPNARAPTDSIAIAASPFIAAFLPNARRMTAASTVTGRIISMLLDSLSTDATARAPKAT